MRTRAPVGADDPVRPAGRTRKHERANANTHTVCRGRCRALPARRTIVFTIRYNKFAVAPRADRGVRPYRNVVWLPFVVRICNCLPPGGVEPLPYAGLVDSARSPKGRANLQVPTAQSFSRLRRQHPYPLCPFGAFPPDRGNRPFTHGSLYGGAIWQCIQKGSRNAAASLFYRFRVLVLWSA